MRCASLRRAINRGMHRLWTSGLLAAALGFAGLTQTLADPQCRPALTFKNVAFSPMQPPTMRRTWTALVAVDASRCAADSRGRFQIVFTRLQEFGPDSESGEDFIWTAPEVTVSVDLAPTETVERYRIGAVTPCPCSVER
jgi:hypothetical protein